MASDAELLRRIAERDRDAFESLYRRYVRAVYGLARRRARDCREAAEATRRAFAAVWSSAGTALPEGDGGAHWLFATAWAAIVGPERPAEDGWLAFRVHAAVLELPEEERVPLELAYWSGRSLGEVADFLGLPVDTVESRTRSALAHLAARLDLESDGEPRRYSGA